MKFRNEFLAQDFGSVPRRFSLFRHPLSPRTSLLFSHAFSGAVSEQYQRSRRPQTTSTDIIFTNSMSTEFGWIDFHFV